MCAITVSEKECIECNAIIKECVELNTPLLVNVMCSTAVREPWADIDNYSLPTTKEGNEVYSLFICLKKEINNPLHHSLHCTCKVLYM